MPSSSRPPMANSLGVDRTPTESPRAIARLAASMTRLWRSVSRSASPSLSARNRSAATVAIASSSPMSPHHLFGAPPSTSFIHSSSVCDVPPSRRTSPRPRAHMVKLSTGVQYRPRVCLPQTSRGSPKIPSSSRGEPASALAFGGIPPADFPYKPARCCRTLTRTYKLPPRTHKLLPRGGYDCLFLRRHNSTHTVAPDRRAPETSRKPNFRGFPSAPGRTRTSTDNIVHKALNLGRAV